MIKRILIIVFFCATLFITSCSDDSEWVEMVFTETGCMNPWDHYNFKENDKTEKIKAYLKDRGIWVKNVSRHQYSKGPFCMSCNCPSGFLIIIQVPEYNVRKAEEVGFKLVQNNDLQL